MVDGGGLFGHNGALEGDHLDSGFGSFCTFIAERAAGAVEGVLFGIDGQYTEDNGGVAVGVEGCDALSDALADVVEVGSAAAYYAAEYDDGIVERCLDYLRGAESELNRPGNMIYFIVFGCQTVVGQYFNRTVGESRGDMAVPFGGDYGHAEIVDRGQWRGRSCL